MLSTLNSTDGPMTNKDISHIFDRIADILELKEDNVFKIRAYRAAAVTIYKTLKKALRNKT